LLRSELDNLAKEHKDRFKVWYTISSVKECPGWKYSIGRINEHMIREHIYSSSEHSVAFVCGPPAMIEHSAIPQLQSLNYHEGNIFEF